MIYHSNEFYFEILIVYVSKLNNIKILFKLIKSFENNCFNNIEKKN